MNIDVYTYINYCSESLHVRNTVERQNQRLSLLTGMVGILMLVCIRHSSSCTFIDYLILVSFSGKPLYKSADGPGICALHKDSLVFTRSTPMLYFLFLLVLLRLRYSNCFCFGLKKVCGVLSPVVILIDDLTH